MLAEERHRLHALPEAPYTAALGETRKVSWSSTISFGGVTYSVPHTLADETVWVRVDGDHIVMHCAPSGPIEVARHQRSTPGHPMIDDAHCTPRPPGPLARRPKPTSAAEAEISELRSGATSAGAGADSAEGGEDSQILRDFQLLAEENRHLKEQIAELEEIRESAGESGAGAGTAAIQRHEGVRGHPPGFFERPTWHWILIAFVLLFSFGLGAFAVDWITRRRHGGYRI